MGLVSFTLVMIATSKSLSSDGAIWIESIDFSHIVLFFMALFFVVHACFIILLSKQVSDEYQHHHYMMTRDILDQIKNNTSYWGEYFYKHKWIPGSHLRKLVEFKIIHGLFRDAFSLPQSFNFAAYLTGYHEKYALELLDVGVFSWMVMIAFAGLNFLRIVIIDAMDISCTSTILGFNVHYLEASADHSAGAGGHRRAMTNFLFSNRRRLAINYLSDTLPDCNARMLSIFIATGYGLLLSLIFVRFLARFYELRLIRYAGVSLVGDYEALLRQQMKVDERRKNHTDNGKIMVAKSFKKPLGKEVSMRHLKNSVEYEKKAEVSGKQGRVNRVHDYLYRLEDSTYLLLAGVFGSIRYMAAAIGRRGGCVARGSQIQAHLSSEALNSSSHENSNSMRKIVSKGLRRTGSGGREVFSKRSPGSSEPKEEAKQPDSGDASSIRKKADFSEIYLFKSEHLYFRLVEIVVMLDCVYMALWAANFISLANSFEEATVLQFVMVIPIVLSLPILGTIIALSAKLSAIRELDFEVIGKVLENDEEFDENIKRLRNRIDAKVAEWQSTHQDVLEEMLIELNPQSDGQINRYMFRRLLRLLRIYMSDAKVFHLFNMIDVNKDGDLSVDELLNVIFVSNAKKTQKKKDEELLKSVRVRHQRTIEEEAMHREREQIKRMSSKILGPLGGSILSSRGSASSSSPSPRSPQTTPFRLSGASYSPRTSVEAPQSSTGQIKRGSGPQPRASVMSMLPRSNSWSDKKGSGSRSSHNRHSFISNLLFATGKSPIGSITALSHQSGRSARSNRSSKATSGRVSAANSERAFSAIPRGKKSIFGEAAETGNLENEEVAVAIDEDEDESSAVWAVDHLITEQVPVPSPPDSFLVKHCTAPALLSTHEATDVAIDVVEAKADKPLSRVAFTSRKAVRPDAEDDAVQAFSSNCIE